MQPAQFVKMAGMTMTFTPFRSSTFTGRRLTAQQISFVRINAATRQLTVCRSMEAGVGLFG